jgi:beta-glucosidase
MDHPELGVDAPYEPQLPPGHSEDLEAEHEVFSENIGTMAPGGDRTSLRLSDADEALIAAASALSENVVVVVVSGSSVVLPWAESVPVVLLTWYSGVEGGTALADVLTGAVEPAGRLPFVITREAAHLPEFDKDAETASYGLFHGQWKLDRDVQRAHYPFGWGLGYAQLAIGEATLSDDGESVAVVVSNGTDRAGSTVVFVRGGLSDSAHDRPSRRLIGFVKVTLEPGESQVVDVVLDWSALDLRIDGAWLTEAGRYELEVGLYAHDPDAISVTLARA